MGNRGISLRSLTGMACAAAGVVSVALAIVAPTDALIAASFENVLAGRTRTEAVSMAEAPSGAPGHREGLWLSRLEADRPSRGLGSLSIGDRISIAGTDGNERRLEVISVVAIDDDVTRSSSGGTARLELVTARLLDEQGARTIRFILDAEEAGAAPGLLPARPKNRSL